MDLPTSNKTSHETDAYPEPEEISSSGNGSMFTIPAMKMFTLAALHRLTDRVFLVAWWRADVVGRSVGVC